MRRTALFVLALTLVGCGGVYDSTYWRHPVTGVTVECEASWRSAALDYGVGTQLRDYCDSLMKRAGLEPITHEEGKQWEKSR